MEASKTEENLTEKLFENKWIIKNWKDVVLNEILAKSTTTQISLETEDAVFTKVLVGTSLCPTASNVGFFWKLLCKHPCLENVKIDLVTDVLNRQGNIAQTFRAEENASVMKTMEIKERFWGRLYPNNFYEEYTNTEGSLVIMFKFTLKNLPNVTCLPSTEEFQSSFKDECIKNWEAILGDETTSDMKIFTKEKTELHSHQLILRVQCPVFASMFGSDFLEKSTGVVNVDDISAKTMRILLHYWYTAELLPSWKDDDTIVEFTYAAGKYQMTEILKMLDNKLGRDFKVSDKDVELLKMTQQLSLKAAETRLFRKVVYKINVAVSAAEVLDLFKIKADSINEENFSALQIFNLWNDLYENNDNDTSATSEEVKLMVLAYKRSKTKIESRLLKLIVNTVSKMSSADELFALFQPNTE